MPKWTHELQFIDLMNAPCEQADWPTAESEESAEALCAAHNADIDALEAEIVELRKDRDRVRKLLGDIKDKITESIGFMPGSVIDNLAAYAKRIEQLRAEFAAANATLNKLREVVPKGSFCGVDFGHPDSSYSMMVLVSKILYPTPETPDDHK